MSRAFDEVQAIDPYARRSDGALVAALDALADEPPWFDAMAREITGTRCPWAAPAFDPAAEAPMSFICT